MSEDIEFYINENGIACVPLKMYNDSLEEIKRLNYIIDKQDRDITALSNGNRKLNNIINNFEKWLEEYISLLKEPDIYEEQTLEDLKEVLDKLRVLKGNSSNE